MSIEFFCATCDNLLSVPDGTQGRDCQCPSCGAISKIPRIVVEPSQQPATSLAPAIAPAPKPAASRAATSIAHASPATSTQLSVQKKEERLQVTCPQCHYSLRCNPELLGTKGQCKQCKHIFVIGENQPQTQPAANQVFHCPKCQQLFEGKAEMQGRRGKCHVCGEIFTIALVPASNNKPADTPKIPAQPAKFQILCGHCQGAMEVPENALGQQVSCPHCQQLLLIPNG